MRISWPILLTLLVLAPSYAWSGWIPIPIFEDNFESNEDNFSGTNGWVSRYCEDSWTTQNVTGVAPKTDRSCEDVADWACNSCNFGTSATWGTSACNAWWTSTNDPRDNFLVYDAPNGTFDDFQLDVHFENHDNDTFGLTFRYQNSISNYLFISTRQFQPGVTSCEDVWGNNNIQTVLYRITGENTSSVVVDELDSKSFAYPQGQASKFRVRAIGNQLIGWIDANGNGSFNASEKVFDLEDNTFDSGKIGLFAYNNGAEENGCGANGELCVFTKVLVSTLIPDSDDDGIPDFEDNCPLISNTLQEDVDDDGKGNLCDNCSQVFNPGQEDEDEDGIGDVCGQCAEDGDDDEDGICNSVDNCIDEANLVQEDSDADAVGDVCDVCPFDFFDDVDEDGFCADVDNCADANNPDQSNVDGDEFGDVCDPCVLDPQNDEDSDGWCGGGDNCPSISNADQADTDGDGIGDACDTCPGSAVADNDGDGICPDVDNCVDIANVDQADEDQDGLGDLCDPCPGEAENDADLDGLCASNDICPEVFDPEQLDEDGDGIGDLCDACEGANDSGDSDGDAFCDDIDTCPNDADPNQDDGDKDGVGNVCDNCKGLANPEQENHDLDAQGDACDEDDDNDGLSDADEADWETDPLDSDSDDDGVPDGLEPQTDLDGDGLIGALDPDRDNDGISDGVEAGYDTASSDTHPSGPFVGDSDPDTTTNPDDSDSDDDGLLDGEEDLNGNGQVDAGESDPNDPNDPVVAVTDGGSVIPDSSSSDVGGSEDPGVSTDEGEPGSDTDEAETTPLQGNPGLLYPENIPNETGEYPTDPTWDSANTSSSGCSAGSQSGGSWIFILGAGILFFVSRKKWVIEGA